MLHVSAGDSFGFVAVPLQQCIHDCLMLLTENEEIARIVERSYSVVEIVETVALDEVAEARISRRFRNEAVEPIIRLHQSSSHLYLFCSVPVQFDDLSDLFVCGSLASEPRGIAFQCESSLVDLPNFILAVFVYLPPAPVGNYQFLRS